MRIMSTSGLTAGVKLGKTVYDEKGLVLLRSGVKLTDSYIFQLKRKNIPAVYVDDALSRGVEIASAIDQEVRVKAVLQIKEIFEELKEQRNSKMATRYISDQHYEGVKSTFDDIMANLQRNKGATMNMAELMSSSLYTYTHSLNVAVLSVLTAQSLGLPPDKIKELGVGALLHDVGKIAIPDEILNKQGSLTEAEWKLMKTHPEEGYRMVKDNLSISAYTKAIIMSHHERVDGSGYPNGFSGDKVHLLTQIVSMADIFDAVTSDRCYRDRVPVYQAVEIIMAQVHKGYDEKVFRAFMQNVDLYPPGQIVRLSNGEKAMVVRNNREQPTRPYVRVLNTENEPMDEVDLMKHLSLFIIKELDEVCA
ncbi:HD-GYP domain-containing protein [Tindallia californiensis]|uniref:HDIG domain-containing protein n=1 Tax=Tindallia californiensis TaxID=159292 RepID=A0A1H3LCJ1_9FIRM|nr:HD-GYP domain-containing protein [Tindallia californiensis]SDY61585.1 HDIG domain-containing protein [Tindallia californiensis]